MRFTCANCMEVFERNEECMMHFRDDAIYLFCSKIAGTNGFIVSPQQRSQPRKNWWLPDGAAMSILVINKKCPQCESIERYRIKRSIWMRLIPKSRYYMCDHCDGRFISVDDSFSVYWPFGKAA